MPCRCEAPPILATLFDVKFLGVDPTNGRYGEVTLETCRECGARWLCYAVAYEGFTGSGRWFRGLLDASPENENGDPTPEGAVAVLAALPWYLAGGSYFASTGHRTSGRPAVD